MRLVPSAVRDLPLRAEQFMVRDLFLPGGAAERLASRHRVPQRFQFRFGFRLIDAFDPNAWRRHRPAS